jgi:Rps23 Pro-64 3,4-dihydroxylase Tpa1-like proline 4-hydroxylase
VLRELNGQVFVEYLEALTGIAGLIPDPHYRGAGLHQILPGGLLKIHADFDSQTHLALHRRINVLLYLNRDWDETYGGDLELWDTAMTHAVVRVAPVANRLLVFETAGRHYHGHPEPLACPPGRSRRSLAWFFYTVPAAGHVPSYAQWRERPGEMLVTPAERLVGALKAVTPAPAKEALRRYLRR